MLVLTANDRPLRNNYIRNVGEYECAKDRVTTLQPINSFSTATANLTVAEAGDWGETVLSCGHRRFPMANPRDLLLARNEPSKG